MKTSLAELLPQLHHEHGHAAVEGLSHGTMTLELLAPRIEAETATRLQDTLFIATAGNARLDLDGEETALAAGEALFVPAATEHRFLEVGEDFAGWAVSWGPAGGEAPAPEPSVFAAIDA